MAVITMLSAKGSPGVTTAVAALATMWPGPVLVADADPSGGDMVPGWLGSWWADGWIRADKGVVSFARSTRQLTSVPAEGFAGHVQVVPGARHVRVLGGVAHRARGAAIGETEWRRIASAARDLTRDGGPDVLVDAGRWVPETPWPLITAADLVLLAVRPSLRHVHAAIPVVCALREMVRTDRLALAVFATTPRQARAVSHTMGLPIAVEFPDEPTEARVFSDGTPHHHDPRHCPLQCSAYEAAHGLHTRLRLHASRTQPSVFPNRKGAA
ncbi:hypothetical protein [Saccharopolyspora phatthalungensis]|uniref:Uncharacterized protein n=1 Tax=Saccharopolyspora phatthalungensis TaxID=664693 RepID=A0A840Q866_9PSEU|nr:hypothetical protein [Saccharopolyspora phatthalungensis]MBB5155931.1 hypothetical protein [Saccharopolyspora phatthalungensis]